MLLALSACSSTDPDEPERSSAPCVEGKLVLVGELDGQPVSAEVDYTGYVWAQLSTPGTLDVSYAGGSVHVEWSELVSAGSTTAASGTVIPPAPAPHAGETLCAASGSVTDEEETNPFTLRDLSLGPSCPGTPIAGSLDGCVEQRPPPP